MNPRVPFLPLCLAAVGLIGITWLSAQSTTPTAESPNEGSALTYDETNEIWRFQWWGRAARTYFLQHSQDLILWNWLPVIESGDDSIKEWGFTSNADRFFLRLRHTDIPTDDPENDDFDNDGYTNLEEILAGTDPFSAHDMPPWPLPPSEITALWTSPTSLDVTWQPSGSQAQEFLIRRQTNEGTWETVATVSGNETQWTDTNVSIGTSYHYSVSASNMHGTSGSAQTPPGGGPGSGGSGGGGTTLPDLSGDPDGDWDGDGVTNHEDAFPHDVNRWRPLPQYAALVPK